MTLLHPEWLFFWFKNVLSHWNVKKLESLFFFIFFIRKGFLVKFLEPSRNPPTFHVVAIVDCYFFALENCSGWNQAPGVSKSKIKSRFHIIDNFTWGEVLYKNTPISWNIEKSKNCCQIFPVIQLIQVLVGLNDLKIQLFSIMCVEIYQKQS